MKYAVVLFVSLASVLLAACSSPSDTEPEQPETRVLTWSDEVSQPATLVHHLEENTLFYARIPSLSALAMAPKPNAMGQLLTDSANEEAVRQIQAGLRAELEAFGSMGVVAGLLLDRQRSPLEIAIQVPPGAAFTAGQISASVRLDFDTRADFQQLLEALSAQEPKMRIQYPATETEPGLLSLGVMPAYYQFQEGQKRLTLLAGFSSSADALAKVGTEANDDHPALKREADMDDSGYGAYLWADTASIIPMASSFLPPQQLQKLKTNGLLTTQEVAFGMGTRAGRGQTSLFVKGIQGKLWELGLPASAASSVKTFGQPRVFFTMALPDADWLVHTAQALEGDLAELNAFLEPFQLSMPIIFDGLAGRLSVMQDESGMYNALEPKDPAAFERLIGQLVANELLIVTEKNFGDHVIEHWHLPLAHLYEGMEMPMWSRSQNGNAWALKQGERWFIASVPQILMARVDREADFDVEPWLESEGQSSAGRSMVLLGTFENLVQTNYHYYLQGMQLVGEVLDTDIDLMSFPPVYAAAIPNLSTIGLSATYQDQSMRLIYSYENHPLDALGGSMAKLSVVGILSAVAIPAYQDYVQQAEMRKFEQEFEQQLDDY